MKKALLIVAMLLLVTPVMATTTITAVQEGEFTADGMKQRTVRIDYSTDVNVRAFALDINIDAGPTFDGIRNFKTGESNAVSPGYGIFPSRFRDFIVVTGPNWVDPNYNPTVAWNEPGSANTGMGWPKMIVEMGTLYAGDANKPAMSGTLFRFDVNSEGGTGTFCITIAANTLRGGVVGNDGNAITASYVGTCVTFAPVGCTLPNVVGMSRAAARAAVTDAGLTIASPDVNGWGDGVVTAVGNVYAQNPAPGIQPCGTPVTLSVVSYPIKDTATTNSIYANWLSRGRPVCWAYPRQCHGDIDGKKQVANWVSNNDLNILRTAIAKVETAIPPGGICADLDHKKQVANWVSNNDLNILRQYIAKVETLIPVCGTPGASDPNYWYFCVPTGVVCPAGVTCAPAGTCPNTP